MTDQEVLISTLREARRIIGEYREASLRTIAGPCAISGSATVTTQVASKSLRASVSARAAAR